MILERDTTAVIPNNGKKSREILSFLDYQAVNNKKASLSSNRKKIEKLLWMRLLKMFTGLSTRMNNMEDLEKMKHRSALGNSSHMPGHRVREKQHFQRQGYPCHPCQTGFHSKDTAAT